MTTTKNNEHKKLNFSSEREQSQACLNSAEHEKNQGRKVLNVPNKREQNQTCLDFAEREGLRPKGNVPTLRFHEFKGEWEKCKLGDIINFSTTRVNSSELNKDNYVSTENMLQDYQGIVRAKSVPEDVNVVSFSCGDILISNIRPYLKKVWKATFNGGCSSDVFVLKANDNIESDYLHYVIANDKFINFVMSGAKGVKMPRGDKKQMETYSLSLPQIQEQHKIARLLSLLDERIATQNKIIDKLQSLIKGISNKLLNSKEGMPVRLGAVLKERSEKTKVNNQYTVLSSTVKGIFSQREYFSKDIASENNVGYKIIRLHDVVLSPQNLWMGNINYNGKFDVGIVSPSYKIFSIAEGFDKEYIAATLKTHRALYNYMLVSEQGASVVRRNLNMEEFEQLVFKIPSFDQQKKIGRTISVLNLRLELANKQKTLYEKEKQYLLRQMFI